MCNGSVKVPLFYLYSCATSIKVFTLKYFIWSAFRLAWMESVCWTQVPIGYCEYIFLTQYPDAKYVLIQSFPNGVELIGLGGMFGVYEVNMEKLSAYSFISHQNNQQFSILYELQYGVKRKFPILKMY